MSSNLKAEPRPVAWQRVSAGGERYGPLSKVHSAFQVQYSGRGDLNTVDVTQCGLPIQSAFNHRFGVYSHKGPVEVLEFDEDTVPMGNLCRVCFPVLRMEPETGSLFEEGERHE